MYTLIKAIPARQLLLEQVPAFVISLVIAESLYRFHSFTLECLAFLLTWCMLDMVIGAALKSSHRR